MILLHIGLEKTGTSAVQRYLQSRKNDLKSAGVLIPDIPHADGHHALAHACGLSVPKDVGDVTGPFIKQCRSWAETILVSSENFSINNSVGGLRRLRKLIDRTGHDATIIVYYREKVQWMHSVYHERVRWGLDEPIGLFGPKILAYAESLPELWRSIFDKVHVRKYRPDMCSAFVNDNKLPLDGPHPEVKVHVSAHDAPSDNRWGWSNPELAELAEQ